MAILPGCTSPLMEELKESGAEVRYVTLADKDINPCKGCYACQNATGKLTAFPAKRKMKIYCLFYLAQKIEADKDYTEQDINNLLLDWHAFADPAILRRELYDYRFLDRGRDGKVYRLAEKQPSQEELVL